LFPYFPFFLVFKHYLSDALILTVSRQVMTLIRSHTEYVPTDLSCSSAHSVVEIGENLALVAGFNTV